MAPRILIVEDDDRIRDSTGWLLEDEGYEVDGVGTAEDGLARFGQQAFDCVLVELMLPGMDGFDCCRALRQRSDVPIIILTARTALRYRRRLGGRSRRLRFQAVSWQGAERQDPGAPPAVRASESTPSEAVFLGDIEVRPGEGVVRKAGHEVPLTKTEFRLLCEMAGQPGRVFSREVLLDRVWGYSYVGDSKLVDAHIHRPRAKVEDDPAVPKHVLTARGLGYKVIA